MLTKFLLKKGNDEMILKLDQKISEKEKKEESESIFFLMKQSLYYFTAQRIKTI